MRQTLNANFGGTRVEMDDSDQITTLGRRGFIQGSLAVGAVLAVPHWMLVAEAQIPAGKKLKIGYIGRGSVSHAYLPTLADADFIKLVSICDLIEDRAKDGAKQHKIPNVFPNIDAMLAGPKFDLLVNTTSMPSHYPVNRKALAAGCHVWSEKPMALEVKDAHELLALAKNKGVHFCVAPTCVTSPQFRFMSDMIQTARSAASPLGMAPMATADQPGRHGSTRKEAGASMTWACTTSRRSPACWDRSNRSWA